MKTNAKVPYGSVFGRTPEAVARAPGRVNLVGEHTDYNGGFVLPTVIPQETVVSLGPRVDRKVRAFSVQGGTDVLEYQLGDEKPGRGWLDFVQGITRVLADGGHVLEGCDVHVDSSVPMGSGLASSAALSIALLRGLRSLQGLAIDDMQAARCAQRAENDFVGAPVGIMDPVAISLGSPGTALFLDTRSLAIAHVPLPRELDLVVIDSGFAHEHASGDYRARRAECDTAAASLGVLQIRDLGPADLPRLSGLPEPLGRRARHVVTENARVLEAVAALRARDLPTLGRLFSASHASMRDDFEVSIPQVDVLVEIASAHPDVIGARLTGGGFGGSVVILAREGRGAQCAKHIAERYAARVGREGRILVPRATQRA